MDGRIPHRVAFGAVALLVPALAACGEGIGSVVAGRAAQAEPASLVAEAAFGAGNGANDVASGSAGARTAALPAQVPMGADAASLQEGVAASRRTAIVLAAERVAPAVVSVNVRRREVVQPRSIWESFFLPPGEREVSGLGSGFIIREDGLVLTNEHVVRGASEVIVTLSDGRSFDAEVVGTDEVNDLALVRVLGASGLPVAPLGTSDDLMIGEWVVAIGNPLGYLLSNYEPTVTAGVVSGVGRNIIPDGNGEGGYYLDMIQTDASINPGNSGGPLVNALGEVVGVNSSILSRSGGSEGLGFAIPIDRARRIAMDLLDDGRVRRSWVGIEVEPARTRGGGRVAQVRIGAVAPGSPAADAGLRPGMVLRNAGGKPIRTPLDWEAVLLDAPVGRALEVTVDDGGRERVLRVVPADLPSVTAERIRALSDFELVTLTPSIRAERRITSEQGALIVSLSSVARQIGLREGDVILQINRVPVATAEDAARLLQRLAGRGPVRVFFERQGRIGSVYFYVNA